MPPRPSRSPYILTAYQLYLSDGDSARFVRDVATRYSVPTLARITASTDAGVRRAAALALGILGQRAAVAALGRLLCDDDRAVRLIADDSIKAIWMRLTSPQGRNLLDSIVAQLSEEEYESALSLADDLVSRHPSLPEGYCQRALAAYACGNLSMAIRDCETAIELNPYEYMAFIGLGQCYLESEQPRLALDYFRQAIAIHPDLEPVRLQIRKLEESLREIF